MAIYSIECQICGEQYIDSTKTNLRSIAYNHVQRGSSKASPKKNVFINIIVQIDMLA